MTKRKPLTRLQRVKLFDDHKGTCCICHFKINAAFGDVWIVEHIKPLWLGGEDNERNMGPAHEKCARDKTSAEAPVKAKSDRVRANYLGIKKPRSIRSWKKFDGSPVYAPRER
jgi:5-methylcytosine-specific restriction enzyme A